MGFRKWFTKTLARGGIIDRVHIRGEIFIQLWDKDGNLKDERLIHNRVQNDGLTHIADQMADQGEGAMSQMAIGTGSGQGAAAVTLATELSRLALTGGTPTHAGAVVTYTCQWGAGSGTGAITECGLFNAGAGGDMLAYQDFTVINKGAADILDITWTLTFTDDGV